MSLRTSDKMEQSEPEDPKTWSIDRVIYEFCQNDTPPWSINGLSLIPDRHELEKIFRANHIDGETLLALNQNELKDDLGIPSYGQRRAVLRAIFFLREKYAVDEKVRNYLLQDGIATPEITHSRRSPFGQSPAYSALDIRPSIEPQNVLGSPSLATPAIGRQTPVHFPTTGINRDFAHVSDHVLSTRPPAVQQGKVYLPAEPGHIAAPLPPPRPSFDPFPHSENVPQQIFTASTAKNLAGGYAVKSLAMNEKPGLLDVLDADIDRNPNRDTSSPFGHLAKPADQDTEPHHPTKPKETKRLAPTLISTLNKQPSPERATDAKPTPEQQNGYLGTTSIPMQDTFYGDDSEDDDNFALVETNLAWGLNSVIARRMLNFYRRPANPIVDSSLVARKPYSEKICAKPFSFQYATIFNLNAAPSVHKVSDWPSLASPKLKPARTGTTRRLPPPAGPEQSHDPFKVNEVNIDDPSGFDEFDYLLEKYPAIDEDEGLPTYGDSGDENDYDEATWAEIEAEREAASQGPTVMTPEQVNQTIDEALEGFKKSWWENKFTNVQVKAHNLWMGAALAKKRQYLIQAKQASCDAARRALAKFREPIYKDTWSKAVDVKTQCQSLEGKLFEILENEHYVRILQSDVAPDKPSRQPKESKPRHRPEVQDDEETIGSDSDMALDTFIVEDHSAGDVPDDPVEEDFNPIMPPREEAPKKARTPELGPAPEQDRPTNLQPLTPFRPESDELTADEADIDSDDSSGNILSPRAKSSRKKRRTPGSSQRQHVELLHPGSEDSQTSDGESDFDAGPHLPKSKYHSQGHTKQQAIDLTLSDEVEDAVRSHSTTDFEVMTPELNPVDPVTVKKENADSEKVAPKLKLTLSSTRRDPVDEDEEDVDKKRVTPKLKVTFGSAPRKQSDQSASMHSRDNSELPELDDVKGIRLLSWDTIEECSDHVRGLRKIVYALEKSEATRLQQFLDRFASHEWDTVKGGAQVLKEGLQALKSVSGRVAGVLQGNQQSARLLTSLFMTYVCCRDLVKSQGPSDADLNESFDHAAKGATKFYYQVEGALVVYLQFLDQPPTPKAGKKRKFAAADLDKEILRLSTTPEPNMASTDDQLAPNLHAQSSSHKKRKRAVAQSQEALDQQRFDQQRIKEEERRKIQMEKKLSAMARDNTAQYYINYEEPLVCLDRHIAQRVKPHQLDGIRFLWREVVSNPKHQGCLLAHTMGLGKTMQVISLLVTIAECVQSDDEHLRAYIPSHLLQRKTLILCPSSLLENWYDELLMWSPPDKPGLLGTIRKILSSKNTADIRAWALGGGVLLLSYDLLRWLLNPPKARFVLKEAQDDLEDWLLNQPTLVIADEAHRMKNSKSKITEVASRFKTSSRIALTGSPLNNHLEEYHTMVNWLAPKYLGTIVQFRVKYVEPIIEGLYADSSAYHRRLCLKKLHVLKKDLEPKVNRADISAIQKDMPPKTEFFITVPLTEDQSKAYDIYVSHLLHAHGEDTQPTQAKLFTWLGDLGILCNHPVCFVNVCDRRRGQPQSRRDTPDETAPSELEAEEDTADDALSPENQDDPLEARINVSKRDMNAMEKAAEVFSTAKMFGTLSDISLSYRSVIVSQIVEKASSLGEKTLIFSHSIPTLDFLEGMLKSMQCSFMRIDGKTKASKRQQATKAFNKTDTEYHVFLISTKAGGLGLNLQGANRVVLFDFNFNPMWEEQAVGRAYRLGQHKSVYVYRFRSGGTFEDVVNNKAVFKTQLFQRVVDKKNPERYAKKSISEFLFRPRYVEKQNYDECLGKDPGVLDDIIAKQPDVIRNIELTETFQKEDDETLTEEELKAANAEYEDQLLERENPEAWRKKREEEQLAFMKSVDPNNFHARFYGTQSNPRPQPATTAAMKTPQQPNRRPLPSEVSVPHFIAIMENLGQVLPTTAATSADAAPAQLPQLDGAADAPSPQEISSADESPPTPNCRNQ